MLKASISFYLELQCSSVMVYFTFLYILDIICIYSFDFLYSKQKQIKLINSKQKLCNITD